MVDFWEVVKKRRSCRRFQNRPVEENLVSRILEAGNLAPSPANRQPWEFVLVRSQEIKKRLFESCERTRQWLFETSGWKWVDRYRVDFLLQAPVIVAVVGDPDKTGADRWFSGRGEGYQHACAAVIQNMLLASTALGLGSLWFSLFDKDELKKILEIEPSKDPIALVCLGYSDDETPQPAKKGLENRVRTL